MNAIIEKTLSEKLENFPINEGSEQRSVGDLVEFKVKEIIKEFVSNTENIKYFEPRSKKSIEDLTLVDNNGNYYYLDSKTHNVYSKFSMPNLTSIDKIKKLLIDDKNNLSYIFVSYNVESNFVIIESVVVKYLWELDSSMLRIGSLGKGQLQISNMNKSLVFTNEGKESWFNKLKKMVIKYHSDTIKRIEKEKKLWE